MARGEAAKSNALKPRGSTARMQDRLARQKDKLADQTETAEPVEPAETSTTEPAQAPETPRTRMGRPPSGREHAVLTLRPDADTVRRLRVYAAEHNLHMSDVFDALISLYLDNPDVLTWTREHSGK